jgi:hypothetical protein
MQMCDAFDLHAFKSDKTADQDQKGGSLASRFKTAGKVIKQMAGRRIETIS